MKHYVKHIGKTTKKLYRLQKVWWLLPLLIVLCGAGVSVQILRTSKNTGNAPFNPHTASLRACLATPSEQDLDCWHERYEVMVAQNSTPKDALKDAESAYQTSSFAKSNCHQIAHIIGRAAGQKYNDVSQAFQSGNNYCWSGYYHGVMEAVVASKNKEIILTNLNAMCADLKNKHEFGSDHYNCVHGLGHGIMELQNDDLFLALKTCDSIQGDWQYQSCQCGVFMENVMNEVNQGHESHYLKNDEPLYPCTVVDQQYKQQCYLMQTSHALLVLNQDYSRVFSLCTLVESPYDLTCLESLGRDVSGSASSDITRTISLCNLGPNTTAITHCYIGAVKDFISYYHSDTQGLQLCLAIAQPMISETCHQTAVNYYKNF